MGSANVLIDADRSPTHLDDPGVVLAEADEDNIEWTRRSLRCGCCHSRAAHRHHRPGSDCALCECTRWSPWNPLARLLRSAS
jgi:hypothetical protein